MRSARLPHRYRPAALKIVLAVTGSLVVAAALTLVQPSGSGPAAASTMPAHAQAGTAHAGLAPTAVLRATAKVATQVVADSQPAHGVGTAVSAHRASAGDTAATATKKTATKVSRTTTKKATEPTSAESYGCGAALAYLRAHAAPGFRLECPGYAWGNQAMTCVYHAPQCGGSKVIAISVPCAAAYKNEASNSWVLVGKSNARIDPYGYCH